MNNILHNIWIIYYIIYEYGVPERGVLWSEFPLSTYLTVTVLACSNKHLCSILSLDAACLSGSDQPGKPPVEIVYVSSAGRSPQIPRKTQGTHGLPYSINIQITWSTVLLVTYLSGNLNIYFLNYWLERKFYFLNYYWLERKFYIINYYLVVIIECRNI